MRLSRCFLPPLAGWPAVRKHLVGFLGAIVVFTVGVVLVSGNFRFGKTLVRASYDWSFDLNSWAQADLSTSKVVIIYMDEASYRALEQPFNQPWDRRLHAELIERLRQEGAKEILFDVLFTDPGPNPEADDIFGRAIQAHGNVFLGADLTPTPQGELATLTTLSLPYEPLQDAAAGWGLVQTHPDDDFIVRQHFHGPPGDDWPSLSWVGAQALHLPVCSEPSSRYKERWVNYYGGPETVPHLSYNQAIDKDGVSPGFFKDKIVFIGARPMASSFVERRDELRSTFSSWNEKFLFMPAVEVHATLFLNLLRGDWLTRLPPASECGILFVIALLFGFGLSFWRPWMAALFALCGALAVCAFGMYLFSVQHIWWPWLVPMAVQIPLALLWAILCKSLEWYIQRRELENEQWNADQRIRQQAALLDKAQDAIFVLQLDGQITFWNKSAEELYGWKSEEALDDKNHLRFLDQSDVHVRAAKAAVLQTGEWNGELRQETKAGAQVLVASRWTLVRDEAGQPQSILVINTDITEKKRLEAQFLRAQRMESIGTLAGGIAHDLNNVLSPILLGVELLQAKMLDESSRKMLATIEASAKRGRDMVKQVLSFARGHEGEKSLFQLSHLIKEMNKIIKETFPKNIETRVRIANELWPINGDATQLHQVLLNLCVNARDAMPDGGKITLEACNQQLDLTAASKLVGAKPIRYVVLSVTDTGMGMPPEIMDKIFEPFFTTKEIGKGTGLGLSTVLSIVKSHNGVLDVKSKVGRGTTFTIYFPAEGPASVAETASPAPDTLKGRNELILVVDDEPAVRESLHATLTTHGYRVKTASHGAEAVSVCIDSRERISAVIMDMMMPVMGGAKAISILKHRAPGLKFLAMSGLLQSEAIREELGNTRLDFIVKPFTGEKLLQSLQQLLNGSHTVVN